METREAMLKGGKSGPALIPEIAEGSPLLRSVTLPPDSAGAMPPADRFERLPEEEISLLRKWVAAGAQWPGDRRISYEIGSRRPGEIDPEEMERVELIRKKILATEAREEGEGYKESLEGVRMKLSFAPIPGGEFLMKGEAPGDEFTAELSPFWMATTEIPWDFYQVFMSPEQVRGKTGFPQIREMAGEEALILAQPSKPYHAMSFGMSVRRHPAIAMTQHAASKFCQWLSYKTGRFYRLPTEAEWEYAARAGATTRFPWGDAPDPAAADELAWYFDNSDGAYHRLGRKKANAFGLHDMLGNVMEWTLDGKVASRREVLGLDRVKDPWVRPAGPYPHVTKGGHWNAQLEDLAFAKSVGSSPAWKASDPQSPKSIWYHTSIMWIGFRPVSPVDLPSAEEMYHFWNSGVEYDEEVEK